MSHHAVIITANVLAYSEPVACLLALVFIIRRDELRTFKYLAAYLFVRVLSCAIGLPLLHFGSHGIKASTAYTLYFYDYWVSYAIEAALGFMLIWSIYNLAMAPLPGLQRLGRLMFRWAAGIAVAIATVTALGPHVSQAKFIMKLVTQLQQTQSVLTLCMLLFVCITIYPMGLSYRSKIFGVSFGLGFVAAADLVGAAWLSHSFKLASIYNMVNGFAICATVAIWMTYFAMPEPKRRMIILPTTSPFLRWNQISMALNDEPGYVVVSEVTSELFAPAELEVMRRASLKITSATG